MTYHNIPYQKFWYRLRTPPAALLFGALTACAPSATAWRDTEPRWMLEPASLTLAPTAIGDVREGALWLRLEASSPHQGRIELLDAEAFELVGDPSPRLQPGEQIELTIRAQASGPGPFTGRLRVEPRDGLLLAATAELLLPVLLDGDGDGHPHPAAGGDDCDDQDATVHPGAAETWYDGLDQDCDGRDDDQDGDGAVSALDCDDQDAAVHPGAAETWYDGLDQDCDGRDDDQDGDGAVSARDCDDQDAEVGPGFAERIDGKDNDCDGWMDEELPPGFFLAFSELFPTIHSKSGTYDDFLELYLSVPVGLGGWHLRTDEESIVLQERRSILDSWVLICSAGLAARFESCGLVADPWPSLARGADRVAIQLEGRTLAEIEWDADWGLLRGGLQADGDALLAGRSPERADWCAQTPSPGEPNLPCPR